MRMLFTTNPLMGHLLPMVPLMRAARAAGHEVVVATGPDLAAEVQRHGFDLWTVGPSMAEVMPSLLAAQSDAEPEGPDPLRLDAIHLFAKPGVARARQLMPLAAAWRPDVVVHELAELAGWEAAAVSGALDVVHGFGTHVPGLSGLAGLISSYAAAELGTPNRAAAIISSPYIDPCPAALQPPEESPFRDVLPLRPEVGTTYPGERLPASMSRLPYDRTIYLTLGTVFSSPDELSAAVAAVSDLEVNVIVTTGPAVDPAVLGPLPAHVAAERFVPQALILRHCDAVVSHTGSGTMLGALAEGLPQVCLPIGADQPANAAQIARTGAGVVVEPEDRTPESIRAAVVEVLDNPAYAIAALRLQAEIMAMPTAEDVLAEITELAQLQAIA